ncbi:pentapeptide repeat-containing protein [Streptomyces griseus]|uniref:Pentapeptide repeat-containing protein n=2 Tax=Streptomyces TaxID=1883 RepID=A0ABU2VVV0_9ACTN|nr:pentapeptide repeat-containing protein [Streptomyces griseus]MDT0489738.1 pentapeptide repeat-containing protein [Streptomyces griseus]
MNSFAYNGTWARCEGASGTCFGVQIRRSLCLVHMEEDERREHLAQEAIPGVPVSYAGTRFSSALFQQVLSAYGHHFGDVSFEGAVFYEPADFTGVAFEGRPSFAYCSFLEHANFSGVDFGPTRDFGPIYCRTSISLRDAIFQAPVLMQIASSHLNCVGVRWESTAVLKFRGEIVDMERSVMQQPVAVSAASMPFFAGRAPRGSLRVDSEPLVPRLLSISGVDASQLTITDFDLSECVFTGAFNLDQISLGGENDFGDSPSGVHWKGIIPRRFSSRRVIAEEHYWRSDRAESRGIRSPWKSNPTDVLVVNHGPRHVGANYRQLRKAMEESKNEPDAADFYYGEMEMRRCDPGRPKAERALVALYWAVSGYGLRATRALVALVMAMMVTCFLLVGFGIPMEDPLQEVRSDGAARMVIETPDAELTNAIRDRFSFERSEKAIKVTLDSVVFRSGGQNLTQFGSYVEMISRVVGPLLLALCLLALRSRIKRG